MTYHYLDRKYAEKAQCVTMGDGRRIENYKEYFGEDTIEFVGDKLPDFPIIVGDTVREATKEELVDMGLLFLDDNMKIINNKVVTINPYTQKFDGDSVVDKTREDLIKDGVITIEHEIKRARARRNFLFKALDIYDAKVGSGRITPSKTEKAEITRWYNKLKEIPKTYDNVFVDIMECFGETPELIKYYGGVDEI